MLGCHDLEGTRYGGSNGKEVFDFNVTVNRLKVFLSNSENTTSFKHQTRSPLNHLGHRRRGLHASGDIPGHGGGEKGELVMAAPFYIARKGAIS